MKMSRSQPPRQAYPYAALPVIPNNYYYEEQEGYVGDYTESDGLSDPEHVPAPGSNEIYKKKKAVATVPAQEHYRQNMYIPQNYYYEPIQTTLPQQMRRPILSNSHRRHVPAVDEHARYYTPSAAENGYRDALMYNSAHAAAPRRHPPPQPTPAPVNRPPIRRHPVTVRTPRYVRRTNAPNVYKRPSTLCLPLNCQPDPAVYRKARKIPDDPNLLPYNQQQVQQLQLERRHSVPVQSASNEMPPVPRNSYHKNVHMTQSDLDAVLARYETVFDNNVPEPVSDKDESSSSGSSVAMKPSQSKLVPNLKNLKPRTPPSIKQKQACSQNQIQHRPTSKTEITKSKRNSPRQLEVEDITTEVLDSMLTELMNSGCENKIEEHKAKAKNTQQMTSKAPEANNTNSNTQQSTSAHQKGLDVQFPNSFNYQDISQNIPKSQPSSSYKKSDISSKKEDSSTPKAETPNSHRIEAPCTCLNSTRHLQNRCGQCPKLMDETGVMELHRSKSYIVNLIDRALSRELGTVTTNARCCVQKEHEQAHARKVMNLMSKHMDKMDKGLCLEITQTLTDSLISNATAPPAEPEPQKQETTCSCNVQDEPLYIKQLRQLRWGHLRHIQREVRRLEDLERFLDSCSSGVLK